MRKFLVALLLLALFVLGADILARRTAEERVAARLKSELRLRADPKVTLGGTPFLFALVRGDIPQVHMSARDVDFGEGVTLSEVELEMRGVSFSLGDVLEERGRIELERGDGRATITEADLNDALASAGAPFTVSITADGFTGVAPDGSEARLHPELTGRTLSVGAAGIGSVPLELPGLGGRVRYGAVSTAPGRASIDLRVDAMTLDT